MTRDEIMTRDEDALRAALTAATATLEPSPEFTRRVSSGGRRRLLRRRIRAASSATIVGLATVVGGPLIIDQVSELTSPAPPASPDVDGRCSDPDTPTYADTLAPQDLPTKVRLLWAPNQPAEITHAQGRRESGSCVAVSELVLVDTEAGAVTRSAVVFGPEPAGDELSTAPGEVTFYEPEGAIYTEAGYLFAVWAVGGGQLRVEATGFSEAELRGLAASARVDSGEVSVDGWDEAAGIDYAVQSGRVPATRTDWTVQGPHVFLTVREGAAGDIWSSVRVGDEVTEVNGRPAFIRREERNELSGAEAQVVGWSPSDGVVAELVVAANLNPLRLAASVGPVSADDPRVEGASQNWPTDTAATGRQ